MLKHAHKAFIVGFIFFLTTSFAEKKQDKSPAIKWLTIEQAEILNKQKPKKILIDVYTDWCGWCKVMDRETYADPQVVKIIERDFYAVKLNAESKSTINFMGKNYEFKSEYRSHDLAVQLLQGQMSYPNTVFMDEQLKMLTAVPGYVKTPEFIHILTYFKTNAYKSTKWDDFRAKQK